MKPIVNADVEKYLHAVLPRRDKVLEEMEKLAKRNDIPIIGPAVGRMLYLLAKISGASRMFEMGSAIGYSTIWLARAAGPRGEVYYSDGSPENHQRARAFCTGFSLGQGRGMRRASERVRAPERNSTARGS